MTDSQGFAPPPHPGSGPATSGYPGYPAYGSGAYDGGYGTYGGYGTPGYGTAPAPVRAAPAPQAASSSRTLLAAAAGAGVLVLGAAVAAAVASAVLASKADDVGQQLGREIGAELGRAQEEQMDQMMDDYLSVDPYATGPYGGGSLGPVEQFPPVEPGELGPDPVLDAYAADCFAGNLQACDDLFFESPPLSAYEEYASTCGGRVKVYTVPFCTELD